MRIPDAILRVDPTFHSTKDWEAEKSNNLLLSFYCVWVPGALATLDASDLNTCGLLLLSFNYPAETNYVKVIRRACICKSLK